MLKIEHTPLDEKETFIHINEESSTITITTHSNRVFNALQKVYGVPHEIYPSVIDKGKNMISGASWSFNYKTEREKVRPLLSMTNLLPHS